MGDYEALINSIGRTEQETTETIEAQPNLTEQQMSGIAAIFGLGFTIVILIAMTAGIIFWIEEKYRKFKENQAEKSRS